MVPKLSIQKILVTLLQELELEDGQKILEIGTGSGSSDFFCCKCCKTAWSCVYTFDVDEKFMKIAEKNIKKAGVSKYITQYNLGFKDCQKNAIGRYGCRID